MRFSLRAKIIGSFAIIVLMSITLAVGFGNRVNEVRYDRYLSLQDQNRARMLGRMMSSWTAAAASRAADGKFSTETEHPFLAMGPGDFQNARELYSSNRKGDGLVGTMLNRVGDDRDRIGPEMPGADAIVITDIEGRVLLDSAGYGKNELNPGRNNGAEIQHEGTVVGYIYLTTMIPGHPRPGEENYLRTAGMVSWVIAAAIFLFAMALGYLLTLHIVRPVRTLNGATKKVKAGDLTVRVPDSREDELGDLSRGFNDMTSSLESADIQRRRLIADSAHELRTPVSLIRTRIEMMEEGVYPMDTESLAALAGESDRLVDLVQELRVLADLESPETEPDRREHQASSLLANVLSAVAPAVQRSGIELLSEIDENLPVINVDAGQVHRLVSNLLNNALRYAGRQVLLSVAVEGKSLFIRVEDDGPGIPEEDLERVFERYYRVDVSRSRESGGSGLGLAICMEIARSHGGGIRAGKSERLGGAIFEAEFPLS